MEEVNEQISRMVEQAREQIENLPYVKPMRIFWQDMQAMRDWWFILIPLLVWVGWRTYWVERKQLEQEHKARTKTPTRQTNTP